MRTVKLLGPLLAAAVVSAQERPDPLRYVTADCSIVARIVGPAVWQRDFAATGFGKAVADPQVVAVADRVVAAVTDALDVEGAERELVQRLSELLRGYGGEVVLAAAVDWSRLDPDAETIPGAVILAVGGDGETDLGALIDELEELLPEPTGGELDLGGVPGALRELGPVRLAGPVVHDGCLVMVAYRQLEEQVAAFFAVDGAPPAVDYLRGAAFGLYCEPQAMLRELAAAAEQMDQPGMGSILELLGAHAVESFGLRMQADGKYVGQQLDLRFDGSPRGLLDVVLPARRTSPRLLRYVPPGAGNYTAMPVDPDALARLFARAFEVFGDDLPLTRDQVEARFTAFTKLRLVEDVLALLGDEYVRIEDVAGALDVTDDVPEGLERADEAVGDRCFVVALRDGKAFAKNLDTALRARGMHVGRKGEDYGDVRVYRLNVLGAFPVEYAVTDAVLVVGIGAGEGTKQNLRGVLDAIAAEAGGAAPPELPAAVRERLEGWPDGWAGIQVASFTEVLDAIVEMFSAVDVSGAADLAEAELLDIALDAARALRGALVRHGVATAVTVDYLTATHYRMRSRW